MARAFSEVDLAAIRSNCSLLREKAGTEAILCAVVKADGYGHGATRVARAALDGGAEWLAVAAASEALALRADRIEAPILVLGAIERHEIPELIESGCDLSVWDGDLLEHLEGLDGAGGTARVHIKLDTGMGRLGTRDRALADELVRRAAASDSIELVGVETHFATADAEEQTFVRLQLERFSEFAASAKEVQPSLIAHAANSAATLRIPDAAFDMVRCGVAIYGLDPFGRDPVTHGLRPALELRTHISAVKPAAEGDSVGYGRKFVAREQTVIATAPIGYADGVLRAVGEGRVSAICGGRRVPIVGAVSMDNITLDLGPDARDCIGDEIVLIGESEGLRVFAEDWAAAASTINYEIVTALGGRVERSWKG